MLSHESMNVTGLSCDLDISEKREQNKRASELFLVNHNIPIDHVKSISPENRNLFLIRNLFTDSDLVHIPSDRYGESGEATDNDDGYGFMIIKPEMFPRIEAIEQFLFDKGIEYQLLDSVVPTKEDWLQTYGYMLKEFPNIVNVYIAQRSYGVRPIVFNHLSTAEYEYIARQRGVKINSQDRDSAFDVLFCGKAKAGFTGTIRSDIVLPNLIDLGFTDMTGYASAFDTVNYYRDSNPVKTFVSFNGVHSPKDKHEKEKNIQTYIK